MVNMIENFLSMSKLGKLLLNKTSRVLCLLFLLFLINTLGNLLHEWMDAQLYAKISVKTPINMKTKRISDKKNQF